MDELLGGRQTSGLERRGSELLRPVGPWTPAVHEYLKHLETVGFRGAPRVVGIEGDHEVLTFLEGDVLADPEWEPGRGNPLPAYARTDDVLAAVGHLLRELHEASRSFKPQRTDYRFHPHAPNPGEIVSHGDLGPWNTVYRAGLPVAFIDWDAAGPIDPLLDLAAAAWAFLPLESDRQLAESGFDPLPDLPHRLRVFVDAYGLTGRPTIIPALQQAKLKVVEQVQHWPIDAAGAAGSLEFLAGELRWLDSITPALRRAL